MELLWTIPYFSGAVAAHGLACRLPFGNQISKFLLVGSLVGIALGVHLYVAGGLTLATVAALSVYAFASELYIFIFTLVASSVSARILLLLREHDMAQSEMQKQYDTTGMVMRRVHRLVGTSMLEQRGDRYRISDKGRRVIALYGRLKKLFHSIGT